MGDKTAISWTNRTLNFWKGCKHVSPGCGHCYADAMMSKLGFDFGEVTRTKTWGDADRWQKAAATADRQDMVFACSWSDFFIEKADPWRAEAWQVIKRCPNLTFQILTKRPGLIAKRLPADWGDGYANVWLGVSVESKAYLWRADTLRKVPAVVHFISAEPLLENIASALDLTHIEWVIVGGESGNGTNNFRPMDHAWARAIRDLCKKAGVAFFFKQSAAVRTEMGKTLDGWVYQEYP